MSMTVGFWQAGLCDFGEFHEGRAHSIMEFFGELQRGVQIESQYSSGSEAIDFRRVTCMEPCYHFY